LLSRLATSQFAFQVAEQQHVDRLIAGSETCSVKSADNLALYLSRWRHKPQGDADYAGFLGIVEGMSVSGLDLAR
jgi:hypothetical protein